jgi:hypothetical protein
MSTARTSLEDQPPATQVTRQHPRTSKLFEREHAYAARLVQIAAAIRTVVRSTVTVKLPENEPPESREDGITAGVGVQLHEHGSGS